MPRPNKCPFPSALICMRNNFHDQFVIKNIIALVCCFGFCLTICPEEITTEEVYVLKWPREDESKQTRSVASIPPCYTKDQHLVTRFCQKSKWFPSLSEIPPCLPKHLMNNDKLCPTGYHGIDEKSKFCFKIIEPSEWKVPCYNTGATTILFDLDKSELASLSKTVRVRYDFKYFWLPATRPRPFHPLVWHVPGDRWQTRLSISEAYFSDGTLSLLKNCVLFDILNKTLKSENCQKQYPAICLLENKVLKASYCPEGYYSFNYPEGRKTCYGIEISDLKQGKNWNQFIDTQCNNPMQSYTNFKKMIYQVAENSKLSKRNWCWVNTPIDVSSLQRTDLKGVMNKFGHINYVPKNIKQMCMFCEKTIEQFPNVQLILNDADEWDNIYISIYSPSGLWRKHKSDIGIQCFSNAKGFMKVIEINNDPVFYGNFADWQTLNISHEDYSIDFRTKDVVKVIYRIPLETDRSGEYWCEGHTVNFKLVESGKILVSRHSETELVFAMSILANNTLEPIMIDLPDFADLIADMKKVLEANKIYFMDILSFNNDKMTILFHVHVDASKDQIQTESLRIVMQRVHNKLQLKAIEKFPLLNITLKNLESATHCFPTVSYMKSVLNWGLARIGQVVAPIEFCLRSNGLPVKRLCGGTFVYGAEWQSVDGECSPNYRATNTTTFLYHIAQGFGDPNKTSQFLTAGLEWVFESSTELIPADIFYLAMSLREVLKIARENKQLINIGDINNTAKIVDQLMSLDTRYLQLSQTLNSTNIILEAINDILEIIACDNINRNETKSLQISVERQYVVQISYPLLTNISGLALIKKSNSTSFTEMDIIPLYMNSTLSEIMVMENLEIATWIPGDIIEGFRNYTNNTRTSFLNSISVTNDTSIYIVISIFYNDAVFQQTKINPDLVESRIIGVSIPGYSTNLKYPLFLVFGDNDEENQGNNNTCGYWDFTFNSNSYEFGFWSQSGCYLIFSKYNKTACACFHLTHFAHLLSTPEFDKSGTEIIVVKIYNQKVLNVITLVGCILSLLGISGIIATAIIFRSWRQKPGTKVLLQLSASIALQLMIIMLLNADFNMYDESAEGIYSISPHKRVACVILGGLLHYSVLVCFTWMLITAILQFVRYVRVLGSPRPPRFMLKFAIIGWGLPLLPITILLILDPSAYIPSMVYNATSPSDLPICYPTGQYFYYGVALPVAIVLLTNIVVFILVMCSILRGPDGKLRADNSQLAIAQLRLSILLFFLLGLTWIFGFMSLAGSTPGSYLFCLTASIQGFVLFIYFVICDPATRRMWLSLMKSTNLSHDTGAQTSNVSTLKDTTSISQQ